MNRRLAVATILSLMVLLVITPRTGAQSGPRTVIVWVEDHPRPWGESQIQDLLIRHLSLSSNLRVFAADAGSNSNPVFPANWINADTLADWSLERGCRYVLIVSVQDERLEQKKGWHLPLIFHKYTTVGIVEADVRLFDAGRGKFIMAEMLTVEKKGPRIFQASMDDNINDPDLHLTTPKKLSFLASLEKEFCKKLIKRMGERVYLRDRDSKLR